MSTDWLQALTLSTLASSAALLLVLALRKPMRKRFGAQAAYALWSLVPLAALVALLPAPTVALQLPVARASVNAVLLPMVQAAPAAWRRVSASTLAAGPRPMT